MNTTFQPETPNGIRLGHAVTNPINGFSGIVTAITENANGVWQAYVQPSAAMLLEPKWYEHSHLVVTDPLPCPELALDKVTFPKPKFALLEPVEDIVTGQTGYLYALTYYTAGSVRYQVRSTVVDHDNRPVYFETDEIGLVAWLGQPPLNHN